LQEGASLSTRFSQLPPVNDMVIIEVDCFRRIEAGVSLPDDDLVAKGMTPGQIHAEFLARLAEGRSGPGFTPFPNDQLPSIQVEDFNSVSDAEVYVRRLSTITERTERTELTEASPTVAAYVLRAHPKPIRHTEKSLVCHISILGPLGYCADTTRCTCRV
jgi:hypothetical protein